ncbi:MAG: excinuclease ABC subunit UvrC, partial [Actinomycetota bacterium]|nr:excinuclease ABC subunit UvrC [Actinomycetota bacterium]
MIQRPPSQSIPSTPGSYLFKDPEGRVLYVGKAKSLRNRVNSYFQKISNLPVRTQQMLGEAESLDWIQVTNEAEALILEHNLIQEHQPRYNVRLRDDKSYPYLSITIGDEWPRATLIRGKLKKANKHFGPYVDVGAIRDTLDLLQRTFPLRTCSDAKYKRYERVGKPCLDFHIKKCCGPCVNETTKDDYQRLVSDLIRFLEGNTEPVLSELKQEMLRASKAQEYEKAARLRDNLLNVQKAAEKQLMVGTKSEDFDVIGIADDELGAAVHAFLIRKGRVMGQRSLVVDKTEEISNEALIARVLEKIYVEKNPMGYPKRIYTPYIPEDLSFFENWLSEVKGSKVLISVPRRGDKRSLMETVTLNARDSFQRNRLKRYTDHNTRSRALSELQEYLQLPHAPLRIECFDMSHIQGTNYVGSMVVMEDGLPKKKEYRRFKIRKVTGNDDYAAMEEVITRRLENYVSERMKPVNERGKFSYTPQLILVDGGKGQLQSALKGLRKLQLEKDIPIAAIAKKHEEIFLPGKRKPIQIPRGSEALYLLQRIRDESHRFAISYHRQLRGKSMTGSALDGIPGLGKARKIRLLQEFGSIQKIQQATLEDLQGLSWLPATVAFEIHNK